MFDQMARQTQGGTFDPAVYDSCIRFVSAYLRLGADDPRYPKDESEN